jgi:hypothetical protein
MTDHFEAASVDDLDEPVRRYFMHAIVPGATLTSAVRLEMNGRIKVGCWLPFTATWEGDGRSFVWPARVGWGPISVLTATDQFRDGAGTMDVRLFGRVPLVHAHDSDTARSAAGRAAVEAAIWSPASLLPARGVTWYAESDHVIVAAWDVPPERPCVRLEIDGRGRLRTASVLRWDNGAHGRRGYIPCGGIVEAEQRFGDLVLASDVTVGWWFGTPRWAPFFQAAIVAAAARDGTGASGQS